MSGEQQEHLRERLSREDLSVSAWSNAPHDRYAEHGHGYDKVLVAAVGSIVFHLPEFGLDMELRAGDRLHLPADTLHGADVGPDGVTCLEAHLPRGSLPATPAKLAGWGLSGEGGR